MICVENSCARRPLTYFGFDDEIRDGMGDGTGLYFLNGCQIICLGRQVRGGLNVNWGGGGGIGGVDWGWLVRIGKDR